MNRPSPQDQATPAPSQPPQRDLRVVEILGIEYFIYWEQMTVGASFFIPTTATPAQALAVLKPVARRLNYKLKAQPRREYGRYGVRVWRMG